MNELMNLQYEDQLYLWGQRHPVGKFPNRKTKQPSSSPGSSPQSLMLLKKKKDRLFDASRWKYCGYLIILFLVSW